MKKLTERQVAEIRGKLKQGKSPDVIAKEYGIQKNTVVWIKEVKSWKWLISLW